MAAANRDADKLAATLRGDGFLGDALSIEPTTEGDCLNVAWMRPVTRSAGLSLTDRACPAPALPVLTADRSWRDLGVGTDVDVRLVR